MGLGLKGVSRAREAGLWLNGGSGTGQGKGLELVKTRVWGQGTARVVVEIEKGGDN